MTIEEKWLADIEMLQEIEQEKNKEELAKE